MAAWAQTAASGPAGSASPSGEPAAAAAAAAAGVVRHPACGATGQGAPARPVDEAGFVRIGGLKQWVVIEGADCRNPVVLIVHGGPGNPYTPYAHAIFGEWARRFTVVHWDQRGAGKTFGENPQAAEDPLTIERIADDGNEVARYLQRRLGLGERPLILMGGSWGSAVAVHMAMRTPTLYRAYVGSSQLVSWREDLGESYRRTLALAREAKDAPTIAKLESMGPPPWQDPRHFGQLRRATRKYESLTIDPAPSGWWKPAAGYDTPAYERMYTDGEDYSYLAFVGKSGDGMGPGIDLRRLGTSFAMPVFLIQGTEDLVTPLSVSRAWFDELKAPEKAFIPVARTGHDPNGPMLQAQLGVLERIEQIERTERTRERGGKR